MQRVSRASVAVGDRQVAEIGAGMVVLLGVAEGDGAEQADRLAAKLRKLRIFDDADGRMNDPLGERQVLCVSQFTLLATPAAATAPATPPRPGPRWPSRCTSASARRSVPPGASSAPG